LRRKIHIKPIAAGIISLAAAVFILPAAPAALKAMQPMIDKIVQDAAILSLSAAMPQGGLALLKERFEENNSQSSRPEQQSSQQAEHEDAQSGSEAYSPDDMQSLNEDEYTYGQSSSQQGQQGQDIPNIPKEYQAPVLEEDMSNPPSQQYIKHGGGLIKNLTKLTEAQVYSQLGKKYTLSIKDIAKPQVLIVHTHTTESYNQYDYKFYDTRNNWRSLDNNNNMAAIGAEMARVLAENGIGVIHDTTQHDNPSYNGAYDKSAVTIKKLLKENPTISVVLDVHRDAIVRDNNLLVKPLSVINGKKTSQIMIIAGCDNGSFNMSNWPVNLRFAANLQSRIAEKYPTLARPMYLTYKKYNQNLHDNSILVEVGSCGNTMEESLNSARLFAEVLSEMLISYSN